MKNKWTTVITVAAGLLLIVCVLVPFARTKYLYMQLGKINITPVLIQDSDLPPGFVEGDISEVDTSYYYNSARAKEQEILASDGTKAGSVRIYLFASSGEQSEFYAIASQVESQEGIIPFSVTGIGDSESGASTVFATDYGIYVVFTRCASLVYIDLNAEYVKLKTYNFDYLVAHAKRLDEDLKQIACY